MCAIVEGTFNRVVKKKFFSLSNSRFFIPEGIPSKARKPFACCLFIECKQACIQKVSELLFHCMLHNIGTEVNTQNKTDILSLNGFYTLGGSIAHIFMYMQIAVKKDLQCAVGMLNPLFLTL